MCKNPKIDCFAYDVTGCRILTGDNDCAECSSYKTWDDCYKSGLKCAKRLRGINPAYRYRFYIPKNILRELKRKYETEKT